MARFSFLTLLALLLVGCAPGTPLAHIAATMPAYPPTEVTSDAQRPTQPAETTGTPLQQKQVPLTAAVENTPTPAEVEKSPSPEHQYSRYELLYCSEDGCIYAADLPFLIPIPEGYNRSVEATYRYGSTQAGLRHPHIGVEFNNAAGTPVTAAADGKVIAAGKDSEEVWGPYLDFYGNFILLQHSLPGEIDPVFTLYGHLSEINVNVGDEVVKGQIIGRVGRTGAAVGSHLHFEVRQSGLGIEHTVNPELWLENNLAEETSQPTGKLIVKIGYQDETVYGVDVLVQNFDDPNAAYRPSIYAETYAFSIPADPYWKENLVVGDIPPGTYRASFTRLGKSYQKYFDIEPDRITLVEFQVDY